MTYEILQASIRLSVVLLGYSMEGDLTRLTELGFWLEKFVTVEFYIGIVL